MAKLLSGTRIYGTATVDTFLFVNGTATSVSTTTGALQVGGGIGANGPIFAAGSSTFSYSNASTGILSSHILLANPTGSQSTVGFTFAGTSKASIRIDNGGSFLLNSANNSFYFNNDLNLAGNPITFINGSAGGGNFMQLSGTTATFVGTASAVSTTTGALQVRGGVGIGGGLFAGSAGSASTITNVRLAGVLNTFTFVAYNGAGAHVDATNAALLLPMSNFGFYSVDTGGNARNFIGKDAGGHIHVGAGNTSLNGNVSLNAGSAGSVYLTTGWGNTETTWLTLNNSGTVFLSTSSQSISTNTGALTVAGGVGIAGNLWVGGTINGTIASSGASTTATNIAGGTAGQVPYQTAPGTTGFFGPGTAGNVLVSNGTSAPTYNNTLILSGTTVSTNTTSGALRVVGGVGIGGSVYIAGSLYATTKSFYIDHPTKPGQKLKYGSLEGPENGVYVRGKLDGRVIELPDYWTALVDPDSITVDLTPFGSFQQLYVEKIEDNKIYVSNAKMFTNKVSCFYTVWAERKDVEKLVVEAE